MARDFIHLHVHTQYTINNGLGRIRDYETGTCPCVPDGFTK